MFCVFLLDNQPEIDYTGTSTVVHGITGLEFSFVHVTAGATAFFGNVNFRNTARNIVLQQA